MGTLEKKGSFAIWFFWCTVSEHNNIASGENPLRANWGVGNIFGFGLVKNIFVLFAYE